MKILVIGDEFVDVWLQGETHRVSPEAPVPVVEVREIRRTAGGAANVKANLQAQGAQAKLLRLVGDPPLPTKVRLCVGNQQLARFDWQDECQPITRQALWEVLDTDTYGAIVVSDYGKGSITEETIEALSEAALPTFVDTKGDPFAWWGVASVLFPNSSEYATYSEEYDRFPNVILKQGSSGLSRLSYGEIVQYEPALPITVVSVCGAGDTTLAAWVAAWADGASVEQATTWANRAGAAAVTQPGTSVVSRHDVLAQPLTA